MALTAQQRWGWDTPSNVHPAEASMVTTAQSKKELVRQSFTVLNERDREGFVALHPEDTVLHDGTEEIHGIDAIADHEFAFLEAFPDLTLTPEPIIVEDDMVAARWIAAGPHEGEFNGIEPTGEEFEIAVMGMFRVKDGRVAEVWLLADQFGLMRQLGIVEPPDE